MMLVRSWWARLVILAIVFAAIVVPKMSPARAAAWSIGLAAIGATGIGMIRLSGRERRDMKLVEQSDRVTSPRDGERVAICGTLEADGEPFASPVRGRPALLYLYTVLHYERFSPSSRAGRKDVVDYAGYGASPARIEGAKFSARLGGFPNLHDFGEKYILSSEARERVKEHLRFARFEEKRLGHIEWIEVMDDMWDGRERTARDFRQGSGRPLEDCVFHETSVPPGQKACAIGIWSAAEKALIATKEQGLWVYRGEKETVREVLATSVGCGRFLGMLMIVGSIGAAIFLRLA